MIKIALDAMGGDNAPMEIIKGAREAVEIADVEIILVGQEEMILNELNKYPSNAKITIENAEEVIGMEEEPAYAVRKKKNSSFFIGTKLVKDKKADAFVSAGSTGAQMASSLLILGRVKGIKRPAIATVFPTLEGGKLLLDVGANTLCKPINLVQYAQMGSIYAEKILEIANPKVGLLNIGTEETKGNDLTKETYSLLKQQENINFIGNIEARDIPYGQADVIVCDGFVGNSIIKLAEGLSSALFKMIRNEIDKTAFSKFGALFLKNGFKEIKKSLDYAEYGGAPLFGVDGVSIICHGSSNAKAIKNAINVAVKCVESNFVGILNDLTLADLGKEESDE